MMYAAAAGKLALFVSAACSILKHACVPHTRSTIDCKNHCGIIVRFAELVCASSFDDRSPRVPLGADVKS